MAGDIAQHLNGCALTMAFVSPNSIASDNCRREVTFALSKRKPFLGVILQETEMSLGMEMQLSAQQCVMKYAYSREEDFIRKLCSCPDLAPCLGTPPKQEPVSAGSPESGNAVTTVPEGPGTATRNKPVKEKKEKPVRHKESSPREAKPGGKGKKLLAVIGAAAAALVLLCVLVSSLTHVKLTDTRTVSTGDTYLNLSGETVTLEMAKKIGRLGKLGAVTFRDCTFQPGALTAMKLPEQLKEFTAQECSGLDDLAFLQSLPNLTVLTLEGCGISDNMLPDVTLDVLRRLNLADNAEFTDLSKISRFQNLTDLDISGTGVQTLEGLEIPGLKEICFSNTKISDVSPLARLEGLTYIQGDSTPVSNVDTLASLETLTVLHFNDCRIQSVNAPFKALRLSQLWLENNGLTGLEAFADCAVLTKAGLAGNCLTDVSVLEKSAATLTYLSLSGNALDSEDLEFLEDSVLMEELYLDGLALHDPYFEDLGYVALMENLKKLSAVGCGLTEIPSLTLCKKLTYLSLANNELRTTYGMENMSLSAALTLDLSYNPIETLRYLPQVQYAILALYGVDADLETLPEVEGRILGLDYQEGLESTHLAAKTFSSYFLLGCPENEKVKTEDLLGSYRVQFLESEADLIARMAQEGLDYSFLAETE